MLLGNEGRLSLLNLMIVVTLQERVDLKAGDAADDGSHNKFNPICHLTLALPR